MTTTTPVSLQAEHRELNQQIEKATREPGALGAAAREVSRLLKAHFQKEEQYAMPPLALLPKLAWGTISDDMAEILPLTKKLKAELPVMLIEHKQIATALEHFRAEAQERGREEYQRCAVALLLHAQEEEELHYPTAVLVGDYLALKLQALEEA